MNRRALLRTTTAVAGGTAAAGLAGAGPAAADTATAPARSRRPTEDSPMRVHLLVYDGIDPLDYAGPHDALAHAGHLGYPLDVSTVTVGEPGAVIPFYDAAMTVPGGWSPDEADVLLVPGGPYPRADVPGVGREIERGTIPDALARAPRPGLLIASVCNGALLLSAAGLLAGRPCTTHHGTREALAAQGARVIDARVVDDGDLVTAGGVTSGIDLALHLLQRVFGSDAALAVEEILEYERRGTVWQRA